MALDPLMIPSLPEPTGGLEIKADDYRRFTRLVYDLAGIKLEGKEGLVRSRIGKRLAALGLSSFHDYVEHVERNANAEERTRMIDTVATNKTDFFRESHHFDFIREVLVPEWAARGGSVRIWSAGCSSGEEPYTLAMVLREALGQAADVRILATDISTKILAEAKAGIYDDTDLAPVPAALRGRYFARSQAGWSVGPDLRAMVKFAHLNLLADWPMRGPFDAILCRNVMIYFDKPTQEKLVNRFWTLLPAGGHLFIGHSESLTGVNHAYTYVRPALYRK